MPIEISHHFFRHQLRARPDVLYAYGGNLAGTGFGGQAKEARDEPNAVEIPTKRSPSMADRAFFSDQDLAAARPRIDQAFERLRRHLQAGGTIVLPAHGIGTGLAQLPRRAPAIAAYINSQI